MLLVDELHNLHCAPVFRQRELLGVLRFLGDVRISVVALGTRDAYLALRLDDQLENRFQPFLLPRWGDDTETGRLLASFESVLPLREPSGLGLRGELRSLIVSRSDGLIGEIHQLLTTASVHALNVGRENITAEDIMSCSFEAPAYRRQIMERELRS